ncbi:hypothetical protein [Gordonia paraffinivorans]|uniref:hypothetical protein n=1 Tax=Gordonia paraffinivorans TaxID=175628 RepID=UPI0014486D3C|nr:hypothetical protein [Gordonia paraffinivorans]MCD2146490.1 hypothetical protein [Gordonia paraffinivorans]
MSSVPATGAVRARVATRSRRGTPTPARQGRQLLLWIHILSSVSWMSQALALLVLLSRGGTEGAVAAHVLDTTVLVISANVSAMSGFLLSSTTPWGFFLHRWVLVKFLITVAQLVVGIAVLSPRLNEVADRAATDGQVTVPTGLLISTVIMASLIAFQGWVSVAKPWPRVPGRSRTKAPVPRPGIVAAAPVALVGDVLVFAILGQPIPVCSLTALIAALVGRRDGRREAERAGTSVS